MSAALLREIASVMGGEVRGNRALFPTPGHSVKDRGSWASIEPGAPDGVLIHCSNADNRTALEIKDLLRDRGILAPMSPRKGNTPWRPPVRDSNPAPEHAVRLNTGQRIVATFEYYGSDGELLYRKHRIEPGRDRPKEFFYDHPDSKGGWIPKRGANAVPYRLPDLRAADHALPIYMAEGEAKADKLASWGLLATSHKDWQSFDFSGYVRGRTVFILPDNDDTGEKLAENAREAVELAEGTAHVIRLPGLGAGEDILDWQGSVSDLLALTEQAASVVDLVPLLDLAALARVKARPKRFAIERLAPAGEVTLFTGAGSAGKSLLSQQLATAAAAGKATLGFNIERMPSLYLTCEDDEGQLHWRQEHISAALGAPMSDLAGKLHLGSLRGELGSELATFGQDSTLRPTAAYKRLVATLQATGARIAFLDNVAHLFTGNENDRHQVAAFLNLLNRLAGETDTAIMLLGHPNKSGDAYSGSTAWINQVRSHCEMEHDLETDMRTLRLGKSNYARKGDEIRFFWQDWAFIGENELPPDRAREFMETKRAVADNDVFLACLAELTRQEQSVSDKANAANYAPKRFARMPEAKGVGKDRLEKALDRLFRIDKIERAELWRGPDRKPVYGLREVREGSEGNSLSD